MISTRRTVVATTALLLLAGCRVGPRYQVPATALPPAYQETDPNWAQANPADAIPRGTWWTVFNDTGLNALEPQVEQANQSLRIADANLRAARAAISIQGAAKLPTVTASPSVAGERYSANRPFFNPTATNNGEADIVLPLTATYEVDLFGRIRQSTVAARDEAQATAADRESVLLTLQAELAVDYFEIRAANAQQELLNNTVKQYQEALRITNNRYLGGIAVKSDLTQAEAQLEAAKVQASDIALRRAQYEHAIAVLIGQSPSSYHMSDLPMQVSSQPPVIPPGVPSQLLERRPDIAAAERRMAEANAQIGVARAAYFPVLNLNAGVGLEAATFANVLQASSFYYAIGPSLAQTLFEGGRRRGALEQANAGWDRTTAQYRETVLEASQQVEDNLVALRILAVEQEQQRRASAAAQENLRIFNNRYVGGVDTYLQVITAQTTLLNNNRNDIDILRRRMDATVLFIKTLGGGWDRTQLPPQ